MEAIKQRIQRTNQSSIVYKTRLTLEQEALVDKTPGKLIELETQVDLTTDGYSIRIRLWSENKGYANIVYFSFPANTPKQEVEKQTHEKYIEKLEQLCNSGQEIPRDFLKDNK